MHSVKSLLLAGGVLGTCVQCGAPEPTRPQSSSDASSAAAYDLGTDTAGSYGYSFPGPKCYDSPSLSADSSPIVPMTTMLNTSPTFDNGDGYIQPGFDATANSTQSVGCSSNGVYSDYDWTNDDDSSD